MDDRAEMGTGTLIVFIATLLVAIAGVASLIPQLVELGSRSAVEGREAGSEASSMLRIVAVVGVRNNTTTANVWDLHVHLQVPGPSALDARDLLVVYSDDAGIDRRYTHTTAALADAAAPSTSFNVTWLVGTGASFILRPDDRVDLHFNLYSTSLAPRGLAEIIIDPATGPPLVQPLAPVSTFGTQQRLALK